MNSFKAKNAELEALVLRIRNESLYSHNVSLQQISELKLELEKQTKLAGGAQAPPEASTNMIVGRLMGSLKRAQKVMMAWEDTTQMT